MRWCVEKILWWMRWCVEKILWWMRWCVEKILWWMKWCVKKILWWMSWCVEKILWWMRRCVEKILWIFHFVLFWIKITSKHKLSKITQSQWVYLLKNENAFVCHFILLFSISKLVGKVQNPLPIVNIIVTIIV